SLRAMRSRGRERLGRLRLVWRAVRAPDRGRAGRPLSRGPKWASGPAEGALRSRTGANSPPASVSDSVPREPWGPCPPFSPAEMEVHETCSKQARGLPFRPNLARYARGAKQPASETHRSGRSAGHGVSLHQAGTCDAIAGQTARAMTAPPRTVVRGVA